MSPKQKKLAAKAPPPNKLDEKDFAVLRAEKAKGRGMGLQDEKVQPGKVQKAFLGKMIKGVGKGVKKILGGSRKTSTANPGNVMVSGSGRGMGSMLPKLLQKAIDDGTLKTAKNGKMIKAKRGRMMYPGYLDTFTASSSASTPKNMRGVTTIVGVKPGSEIGKGKKKFKSMEEMRKAKGFKTIDGKQETSSQFNKRRTALAGAKQVAKSTRLGKIVLPIAAAGVAAQQYLKSKMKKKDEPKKKMGGGMMKKYSKGSEKKLMTPEERADYVKKAKVSLKATAESLKDKLHPKKSDRLFSKHKKMGGGMMQKPIGYKSGMGPAGAAGSMAGRSGGRRPMKKGPKGGIGSLGKEKKENIPNIIITKGGAYTYTKPKVDEKKGRHFRQHKTYDASPRLISEAKGKTFSLRSMNVGGMTKPMGYSKGTMVKARGCKLGRTKPTKIT
jgi:hypothetical protein